MSYDINFSMKADLEKTQDIQQILNKKCSYFTILNS